MALESSIEGGHMKNFILGVATIILSVAYFAEPVAAQAPGDLVGEWAFILEPPQRGGGGGRGGGGRGGGLFAPGQMLVFTAPGGALAGTLRTEQGSTDLTGVMLEGDKITFTLARQTQRGSCEATYIGTIGEDGDSMAGTFEIGQAGGFTINWTATRAGN